MRTACTSAASSSFLLEQARKGNEDVSGKGGEGGWEGEKEEATTTPAKAETEANPTSAYATR